MAATGEMNATQKVAYVEFQIRQAERGNLTAIDCPYCGITVPAGAPSLCCPKMGKAVAGVLHRMETQDQLDAAARIADGAHAQESLLVH